MARARFETRYHPQLRLVARRVRVREPPPFAENRGGQVALLLLVIIISLFVLAFVFAFDPLGFKDPRPVPQRLGFNWP